MILISHLLANDAWTRCNKVQVIRKHCDHLTTWKVTNPNCRTSGRELHAKLAIASQLQTNLIELIFIQLFLIHLIKKKLDFFKF